MKPASQFITAGLLAFLASTSSGDTDAQMPASGATHGIVKPDEVKWRPLRPGAEIAVVSGDPDKPGAPFVNR